MKRARFSEEQIIGILKAAEAAGNIREVCREHNIAAGHDQYSDLGVGLCRRQRVSNLTDDPRSETVHGLRPIQREPARAVHTLILNVCVRHSLVPSSAS